MKIQEDITLDDLTISRLNEIDLEIFRMEKEIFILRSEKSRLLIKVGSVSDIGIEQLKLAMESNTPDEDEVKKENKMEANYIQNKSTLKQTRTGEILQKYINSEKINLDKPNFCLIYSQEFFKESKIFLNYLISRYKFKNIDYGEYDELDLIEENKINRVYKPSEQIILYKNNFSIKNFTPSLLNDYTLFFKTIQNRELNIVGVGTDNEFNERIKSNVEQTFKEIIEVK